MTRDQVRNLVGVVIASVVIVVVALVFGTRPQKEQAIENAVSNLTEVVQELKAASSDTSIQTSTVREGEIAGARFKLSFSEASGTITYSGIDSKLVEDFFSRETEEIDGLKYTMQGEGTVQVSYLGFSELDDQIVADWLIEDAKALTR